MSIYVVISTYIISTLLYSFPLYAFFLLCLPFLFFIFLFLCYIFSEPRREMEMKECEGCTLNRLYGKWVIEFDLTLVTNASKYNKIS